MSEIRSYRRVFDLERRLYSVDSLRLNPGGIPMRGIVYLLIVLGAVLLAARLPGVGVIVGALPWYVRDVAFPVATATLLGVLCLDGRAFHLTARSLVLYCIGPRQLSQLRAGGSGGVWWPAPIVMLPDGSDPDLRSLRYTGPGAVLIAREHELEDATRGSCARLARWRTRHELILRDGAGRAPLEEGRVVVLARGTRLLVERAGAERRSM